MGGVLHFLHSAWWAVVYPIFLGICPVFSQLHVNGYSIQESSVKLVFVTVQLKTPPISRLNHSLLRYTKRSPWSDTQAL